MNELWPVAEVDTGALPEDLELVPPGPHLAVLLDQVDRRGLSGRDRTRLTQARGRLAAHVQAQLLADIYAMSREDVPDEEAAADPGASSRYRWAEVELAFAMRWTRAAAGARLEQARQLVEDFPALLSALATGEVDMPKVLAVCELVSYVAELPIARELVETVLEDAPELTTGQLRARLRKLVLAVDPQAALRRAAVAVTGRRVESLVNPDGTGDLWARSVPAADSAAAWERLTAIARAAKATGDARPVDQLRADALLDLLVGEGVAVGGPVGVHTGGLSDPDLPDQPGPAALPIGVPAGTGSAVGGSAGATAASWDPAWPAEPFEPIGPGEVWPHPAGAPVDRADREGNDFDGPRLWPSDWPGRWRTDPAVAAAAGLAAANDSGCGCPGSESRCGQCRRPVVGWPAPRKGVVELQVPLLTLLRLAEHPGELTGWGPVVADIARQIATRNSDGTWRFHVLDELGTVAYSGITRQRPSAAVAAHIRARDHTCVAPGCRQPARICDIDHTIDKVHQGHSGASNLGSLCRMHHLFKHAEGSHLVQFRPGTFGWITPRGLQYTRRPHRPLRL